MELAPEVVEWIEDLARGKVVRTEHQGRWRPHFFVDVEQPDGSVLELLVRFPRDPELVAASAFLSRYTIAYEARVLEALADHDLPVPRYYGFNDGAQAILMERVAGTNALGEVDEGTRRSVLRKYVEHLHHVHTLPVDHRLLTDDESVDTPTDLAFAQFRYMEQDYETAKRFMLPEPLLEFAIWWLHENVPEHRSEAHWLQGDTGPGQFIVDGGRITALIDWELSFIGDPMSDLGVMRMRNMIYPIGDGSLAEFIDYYAELDGQPVDRDALCYYTVMATLLSPLGMATSIQRPDAGIPSMLPRFGWDVTLRRGLCDALCEAYGVEVNAPEIPNGLSPVRTDLHQFLVDHLALQCAPIATDEFDQFLMAGARGVAETLERANRIGGQLANADLDDMERVLRTRPDDSEAGLAALSAVVASDPSDRALDLLWLFSRMERRREHLWEPIMVAQSSRAFERLYPATERLDGPEMSVAHSRRQEP